MEILLFIVAFILMFVLGEFIDRCLDARARPAAIEPAATFDYTKLSDSDYAFLTASGWEPDDKTKRHFEGRFRKVNELAAEQRRGIAQQRAMLEAQRQLDSLPIDGIKPQHPQYKYDFTYSNANDQITMTVVK